MDIINIKIKSEDTAYSSTLGARISDAYSGIAVNEGKLFDCDFILSDNIDVAEKDKLIFLRESNMLLEDIGDINSIAKYTNVKSIVKKIKDLYMDKHGQKNYYFDVKKPTHLAFLGVSGGTGTSSIALGVARELSRYKEKRTLYLSFEHLESDVLCMHKSESKNCSDLVYYLIQNRKNEISNFWETYIYKDEYEVERIYPSAMRNELALLDSEGVDALLASAWNSGRYDYVILDLGNRLDEVSKKICVYGDKVFLIDKEDSVKKSSIPLIKEYLGDLDIYTVTNFSKEAGDASVEEDENSFCIEENSIEISLSNAFGVGIKRIVEGFNANVD